MATATRTKHIQTFLAMPASLRPFLIGTASRVGPRAPARAPARARARARSSPLNLRSLSTSLRHYAASKSPAVAALVIPEFRTSPLAEVTPGDLYRSSSLPSAPSDETLQDSLAKLFTKNPAVFAHGGSDFYDLKKNTRVPEVCILGRSNVGKSSFVNALASRQSNNLAFVSSKAGRTRSINAYGFGPAPLTKDLVGQSAKYKGQEDIPTHAFHLVDMPGYGHASLKEWGHNIGLYLGKRTSVKGAIVLVDAEVGPKASDFNLLELLSVAQLRTTVVLTKADKVKNGLEGLRETCVKIWEGIQDIEHKHADKVWDWDKEIFVTAVGAKDHSVVSSTIATARLAVARLAGLVNDNRPKPKRDQKWTGKLVSFDDLLYTPSKGSNTAAASSNRLVSARGDERSTRVNFSFADLSRMGSSPFSTISQARPSPMQYARAFHTTASYHKAAPLKQVAPLQQRDDRNYKELQSLINDFTQSLRPTNTARDAVRREQQNRERQIPQPKPNMLRNIERREAERLKKRFPEQALRTQAVHERRLLEEQRRAEVKKMRTAEKEVLKANALDDWPAAAPTAAPVTQTRSTASMLDDWPVAAPAPARTSAPAPARAPETKSRNKASMLDDWPVAPEPVTKTNKSRGKSKAAAAPMGGKGSSEVMDPDVFNTMFNLDDMDSAGASGSKDKKKKKKNRNKRGKEDKKGKKGGEKKKPEPPLDPFEARFAQNVVSMDKTKVKGTALF
ncbi:hypothetical protein F4809DRAFT_602289 [Biscogniauxia mediterranea]|nr:hypothetical protein F4809DRAFT_602289 [Biscogniauxia mediterranea]